MISILINNIMGQASQKIQLKLKEMGYQNLPSGFSLGEDKLFRSQTSSLALKGLSVLLNPKEVDDYLSHLPIRKQNLELVQVLYVDVRQELAEYCKVIVYIQNLPLRLSQTYCLPFNNMIKILYRSLLGFKVLFQKFGYFTIDSSLIAINEQGISKCWMNQKFSSSTPKPSFSYTKAKNGEASMIAQLKEIFRCQVDRSTIPPNFTLQGNTFEALIKELSTKYGDPFLNFRLELTASYPSSPQKSSLSTIPSSGRSVMLKSCSTTQIRFNYHVNQPKQQKITFNNSVMPEQNSQTSNKAYLSQMQRDNNRSVEATRGGSTSIQNGEKTKINFSYQQKPTPVQPVLQRSLIYQLENSNLDAKKDEIVQSRDTGVIINGQ